VPKKTIQHTFSREGIGADNNADGRKEGNALSTWPEAIRLHPCTRRLNIRRNAQLGTWKEGCAV
jgi:hypothetical protein